MRMGKEKSKLSKKINILIVIGVILLSIGAYYVSGSYLMTMFSNRPCIQFWTYRSDPTTEKAYLLPNGTKVHGIGIENVKIELWDTVDIPPIIPTGEKSCIAYTRDWGLTFFQFAFEEQLDRVWHWKATSPDGTIYTGALYLPIEGIDIYIFIEESKGLTHIYPSDLLRIEEEDEETEVTARILINDMEATDETLYLKTNQIIIRIEPSDPTKIESIRATLDGNEISLLKTDAYYIAELKLEDGRHLLTVEINGIQVASIGLKIDGNYFMKIAIGIVSLIAGAFCIFEGVRGDSER